MDRPRRITSHVDPRRGRSAGLSATNLAATMQVYLKAVIGPRTELEDTGLLVEWEVLHVDLAGWLINGRGLPLDQSLMVDGGLRGQGHLEVAVRAASEHISGSGRCGGRAYFVLPIRYQAVFFFVNFSLLFSFFAFSCFFFSLFLFCIFFLFCFILACALTLPWRRRKQVLAIGCTFRARETANATISYAWPAREIRRNTSETCTEVREADK